MAERNTYVCNHCGSNDILFDAYAAWDVENQRMSLVTTFDKGHMCEGCGEYTEPVEVSLGEE